jgi:hypothetical protein
MGMFSPTSAGSFLHSIQLFREVPLVLAGLTVLGLGNLFRAMTPS